MKWLPPMASASPSPVTTHTDNSGRAIFKPVAMAGARPRGRCVPSASLLYGKRGGALGLVVTPPPSQPGRRIFKPGGGGGRGPVDAVHSVSFHVVRKAAGAA